MIFVTVGTGSFDELVKRTKEAISLYLEAQGTSEVKSKFLGLQQVEIGA